MGKPLWNFEEPLYTLIVENVRMPGMAKPQAVSLLELLEDVFRDAPSDGSANDCSEAHEAGRIWEPDTSRLKYLLLALIEHGQRHDYHDHGPPTYGKHACARKGKSSDGKEYVYCRYLFPREMRSFPGEVKGCILEDPHRPDLRNLFLKRNDLLDKQFRGTSVTHEPWEY